MITVTKRRSRDEVRNNDNSRHSVETSTIGIVGRAREKPRRVRVECKARGVFVAENARIARVTTPRMERSYV